ncbi:MULTISPECIES: polysaccharide deacetylase family protein [unclassified Paenibacillus]|uniref:polysaccharide deacetylase family protein n=1 Tax=unclassified Paenibacillus TaxID=185978 RepID=UPI0010528A53|nr:MULTISPECIES: polysaccharide deacetylase family protein [unclassified Paenibacillus]NIK70698.1 peptidoglycan/xylan/chitin deacetylase (PgdA/CDA1 family) [Paenibacillus sp. BK720]TCM93330.1 peptidoglycan/xylan/chitin deacetylase (PgdA/CDA1 family) [Paenibacillus sp. BK033]
MVIQSVNTSSKAVAFTFDDGPHPVYTPELLKIFAEAGGKATFYMIGEQIAAHPEVARLVHEQGHEIGNHSYTHPNMTELSDEEFESELSRTEELIKQVTGTRAATMRLPYLARDERVDAMLERDGYPSIGAVNMEAKDWDMPGVDHILETTRKEVRNGSILIFHDGFGDRSQSVEAVRVLTKELTASGYRLVTVSELLRLAE